MISPQLEPEHRVYGFSDNLRVSSDGAEERHDMILTPRSVACVRFPGMVLPRALPSNPVRPGTSRADRGLERWERGECAWGGEGAWFKARGFGAESNQSPGQPYHASFQHNKITLLLVFGTYK